jgi:hypothetical protein
MKTEEHSLTKEHKVNMADKKGFNGRLEITKSIG